METKETLQPPGCSTMPCTNTMLSVCLYLTLLALPKDQVWCPGNVLDYSCWLHLVQLEGNLHLLQLDLIV